VAMRLSSPSPACFLCSEVADSGIVVTQKQHFATADTHAPTCATPVRPVPVYRYPNRNRIFLGGQRRGACRLSPGLHHTSQQSVQAIMYPQTLRGQGSLRHPSAGLDGWRAVRCLCLSTPPSMSLPFTATPILAPNHWHRVNGIEPTLGRLLSCLCWGHLVTTTAPWHLLLVP
jgi:hypothetical protein